MKKICQDTLNAVDIKTNAVFLYVIQLVLNLFDCFHNHMELCLDLSRCQDVLNAVDLNENAVFLYYN